MLYKEELLSGDSLLSWHAKLEEQEENTEFKQLAIKQTSQFIDWLKQRNEESDEEEEDDSSEGSSNSSKED